MIMPAMVLVTREFQAAPLYIPLSLSFYLLGGSCLQLILGPLSGVVGKKRLLVTGNIIFLLATMVVPFASSIEQFMALRFVQGTGCCFVFIGYAMIHELFDDVQAIKLTSIISNAAIFAPIAGPVLGTAVISQLDWRYVFVISGALGVTAMLGLLKFMPDGDARGARLDLRAVVASYAGILGNRQFMFGIFIGGMAIAPLTAWIAFSPIFILNNLGASYGRYIAYQCVILAGFALSSIAIQRIGEDYPVARLVRIGGALALLGMLSAGLAREHVEVFSVCMFVYSAGLGLFNGTLLRMSVKACTQAMPLVSSAMSFLYCVYISLWLLVYNKMADVFGYRLSTYALMNIPVICLICACLWLFLRPGRERAGGAKAGFLRT
jgi:DHA1 family multidrug/chloramphenicol efflux transport protein-like MFS transporter